jgi:hypothetical protein
MMINKRKLIVGVAVAVLAAGGATGVALASGSDTAVGEHQGPITGAAYDQATARALETVGSGRVTETEVGDEESYYQVEITKPDGSQVDVNLDESFNVVHTKSEAGETAGD